MIARLISTFYPLSKTPAQKYTSLTPRIQPEITHTKLGHVPANVYEIVRHIQKSNYTAYLVGGCVRDLLTGVTPKDFDIATNARPHDLLAIFPRRSTIIGRRFPIVHVFSGNERIEVATFRGTSSSSPHIKTNKKGQILVDNHYGTESEDSFRRDLTINALYYDPLKHTVIDYVKGIEDIHNKVINVIGVAKLRFCEDPLRMLRCIRFANKLDFTIEKAILVSIRRNGGLLRSIAPARLFDEFLKLIMSVHATKNFSSLREMNLVHVIFPSLHCLLHTSDTLGRQSVDLIHETLVSTEKRLAAQRTVSISFVLSVLLWPLVRSKITTYETIHKYQIRQTGNSVIGDIHQTMRIPKRFALRIIHFWELQYDLQWPTQANATELSKKRDFRAAYDLLYLRTLSGELPENVYQWWKSMQTSSPKKLQQLTESLPKKRNRKKTTTLTTSSLVHLESTA